MSNKQKAWRRAASAAKHHAITKGVHEKGRRYGRYCKAMSSIMKFVGIPSTLFQCLAIRAGHIKGESS